MQLVERKRQGLSAMLVKLRRLQDEAHITGLSGGVEPAIEDDEGHFDEIILASDDAEAQAEGLATESC